MPDDGTIRTPLRGSPSLIADNIEGSLAVPTEPSVRSFAVKLIAENQQFLNQRRKLVGGNKVSATP